MASGCGRFFLAELYDFFSRTVSDHLATVERDDPFGHGKHDGAVRGHQQQRILLQYLWQALSQATFTVRVQAQCWLIEQQD